MFACASHPEERKSAQYPGLVGKRILVVDDEAVVCVDYLYQLREIGALAEAFLPTNAAALAFLQTHAIDAAILDYRLPDGTSEPLMTWLRDHHIPFVVISGWTEKLRSHATTAQILEKPAPSADLWQALSGVLN
jgi:CheY-like chemotaxis protein